MTCRPRSIADGVECLGVGTAAGSHEGGREYGSEDGVPSESRLKFSLAQTANVVRGRGEINGGGEYRFR